MLNTQSVPINLSFYTIFKYLGPFSANKDGEGEYNVKKVTMILGKSTIKSKIMAQLTLLSDYI